MLTEQRITENGIETINKVDVAIARIREFEPEEGYYVAFSGGKDSVVILDLVKRAGVKFDAHYNLTTVDPPELVRFIKKEHPEVEIHMPEISMWRLIEKGSIPPTRFFRYCCDVLKEGGGEGRVVVTGVRWAESSKRNKRRVIEQCSKSKSKTYLNPIVDWSDVEVWEFIRGKGLPYCKLYDEGFKRLGCVMCPMTNKHNKLREADRWPKYYQAYIRAFDRMIAERNRRGKATKWQTGQEVMYWWIHEPQKGNPDQTVMFE